MRWTLASVTLADVRTVATGTLAEYVGQCETGHWARERGTALVFDAAKSLVQRVDTDGEGVIARYGFDDVYARAHPEFLDAEHLALLHGIVGAKMFDDDVRVLDDRGLAASLRWPSVGQKSTRLTRAGGRT